MVCGKIVTFSNQWMPASRRTHPSVSRQQLVLILSHDAVAAALLGALVETLGCEVHFGRPPELPEDSVRRVRPRICLVDCNDPRSCRTEFLGRATMRGLTVVIYGTAKALERLRAAAIEQDIQTLIVPPTVEAFKLVLQKASND